MIEARSAERLGLLARALTDPDDARLYASLELAELRHRDMFLTLARDAGASWSARALELVAIEADILATRPVIARIH